MFRLITLLFLLPLCAKSQCLTLDMMERSLGNNIENLGRYLQEKGYSHNQGLNQGSYLIVSWANKTQPSAFVAYIGTDDISQKVIGISEVEYKFDYKSVCYDEIRAQMLASKFIKDKESVTNEGALIYYYRGFFINKNGKWPVGVIIEMPSEKQNAGKHYAVRVMMEDSYKIFLKEK